MANLRIYPTESVPHTVNPAGIGNGSLFAQHEGYSPPLSGLTVPSYVANIFSSPALTDTTSATTIIVSTNRAIAAGNTAFFELSSRGGSTQGNPLVSIGGLPGDTTVEIRSNDRIGSPAV